MDDDIWADFDSAIELGQLLRQEDKQKELNTAWLTQRSRASENNSVDTDINDLSARSLSNSVSDESSISLDEGMKKPEAHDLSMPNPRSPDIPIKFTSVKKQDQETSDSTDSGVALESTKRGNVDETQSSKGLLTSDTATSEEMKLMSTSNCQKSTGLPYRDVEAAFEGNRVQEKKSYDLKPSYEKLNCGQNASPEDLILEAESKKNFFSLRRQLAKTQLRLMHTDSTPNTPANTPDIDNSLILKSHRDSNSVCGCDPAGDLHSSVVKPRRLVKRDLNYLLNTEEQMSFCPSPENQPKFGIASGWHPRDSDVLPNWSALGVTTMGTDGTDETAISKELLMASLESSSSESDLGRAECNKNDSSSAEDISELHKLTMSHDIDSFDLTQRNNDAADKEFTGTKNRDIVLPTKSDKDNPPSGNHEDKKKKAFCHLSNHRKDRRKNRRNVIKVRPISTPETKFSETEIIQSNKETALSNLPIQTQGNHTERGLHRRIWSALRRVGKGVRSVARMCSGHGQ